MYLKKIGQYQSPSKLRVLQNWQDFRYSPDLGMFEKDFHQCFYSSIFQWWILKFKLSLSMWSLGNNVKMELGSQKWTVRVGGVQRPSWCQLLLFESNNVCMQPFQSLLFQIMACHCRKQFVSFQDLNSTHQHNMIGQFWSKPFKCTSYHRLQPEK